MEITKKKKEEGRLRKHRHVDRGKPVHLHKPQFTLKAVTNARGQSTEGKNEPPVWDIGAIPPKC